MCAHPLPSTILFESERSPQNVAGDEIVPRSEMAPPNGRCAVDSQYSIRSGGIVEFLGLLPIGANETLQKMGHPGFRKLDFEE